MTRSIHLQNPIDRLDGLSRRTTWIVLAVSFMAFLVFDNAMPEVGTGPLYIPLIALAGWRLGQREACGVALAAAFLNILPIHGFDTGISPVAAATRGLVRFAAYAFVGATVCALRRVHDRERYAARYDALTGALNRASFEANARAALGQRPTDGPVVVLALADLDGFKAVNDTFGHGEGDQVLRRFAKAGTTAVDEGEWFGRLGGDEFVLLLQAANAAAAATRVGVVHAELSKRLRASGHSVDVSIGALIVRPNTVLDWEVALREADRLMYVAKRAVKGSYRVGTAFVPTLSGVGAASVQIASLATV
ncbi:GGDEF domain-containing protein [Methylobacterium sp. WL122]|nr:GGDEF domain-containing protein [Methylobacterium sp. WL122]